ncbi:MAG: HAMP domain-containing sensor histidine kinase [Caldilineaceae bacterium]
MLLWCAQQVWQADYRLDFCLLLILAILTAFTTSTVKVGDSSITYAVDPIVSFAAIPTFGASAAIVIKTLVTISTWLIKRRNPQTWKKNWQQLVFNSGMHAIATFAAAVIFWATRGWFGDDTLALQILPWIPAALVYDQVNLWLLIGVLRLQQGATIHFREIWREEIWATQLFVITYAVGGGLLAFAIQRYDRLGIVIFFLPILLSAYAFRLYVRQMQAHMDNLEQIVTTRTQELAKRSEQLEDANRQKDSFLAILTHDMMTPLSSIRYCADLIRTDSEINEENQRLAELIMRSQETLFHMVRNILDIEKVVSGASLSVNKLSCDLNSLLHEIAETLSVQANSMQISFFSEIAEDLPSVTADPIQMERIVTNLLSNALKYTTAGGKVWLRAGVKENEVFISVEDTGYGIESEELLSIFEHFRRGTRHKDKAIGSGLGLAITKALVEEHDGVIEVESHVGVGSKFTVKLPIID